jgi:D-alanine-D-alanine ligase
LCNEHSAWTWQTKNGLKDGTLFILPLDVPRSIESVPEAFRRNPEWLYGEGVGSSRGALVSLEFALQALRAQRVLRKRRVGVLFYTDEGRDAIYSEKVIRSAASRVKRVIALGPARTENQFNHQRRGQRKYSLLVEGAPRRIGHANSQPEVLLWFGQKLDSISKFSSRKERIAVSAVDVKTEHFSMLTPHRLTSTLLVSYLDAKTADDLERRIRNTLGKSALKWKLDLISDRPPMKARVANKKLAKAIKNVASEWEIQLESGSSLWPSVGGLVTGKTAVVCGLGPVVKDLYAPREAVQRLSLIQRTIVLAQYLLKQEA